MWGVVAAAAAELIKVEFDTRVDILLSNHDRGSQLHTLSPCCSQAGLSE